MPIQLLRTARLVYPGVGLPVVKARIKYCLRGLLHLRATQAWCKLLEQPLIAVLPEAHPNIYSKLQRPYLHIGLSTNGKLAVLQQHFGFLTRKLSRSAIASTYADNGFTLAEFALEEVGCFELRLLYTDKFEKEGDLSIGLFDCSSGVVMFSLTFSITSDTAHSRELFIGGLQGNKLFGERERIIAITRSLHGLRPKALLVFALRQVALDWEVNRIRAVSNGMHIYRHWTYANRRKRKSVVADYDAFWGECDGVPDVDGMFSLPVVATRRALSTLKPNKRSQYRQRYEMLEELAKQIALNLAQCSIGREVSAA